MSTTEPDRPSARGQGEGRPDLPIGLGLVPGNAELIAWLAAALLVAIVALIADELGSGAWLDFFKWTTAAYLLSRGIAKASRVFEY